MSQTASASRRACPGQRELAHLAGSVSRRSILVRSLALLWCLSLLAAGAAVRGSDDPLAPTSSPADALVGQLHTATLISSDLEAIRSFYVEGLGLTLRGPIPQDAAQRGLQRRLWGIPEAVSWDLYLLHRPAVPGTIRVRLLLLDRDTPRIHSTWNALEPGPFSLGFPAAELEPWDQALRGQGFESMNPMSRYTVQRPDGTGYGMHETIWKAPDFMHTVTLSRRDGMPQLGPVDDSTGRGGPVYSAQIIRDSDRVLAFYTDVLGFELRSDREWKSHGSKGALAVPDGTVFRFSILYAPGASHGHLLFVDFRERSLEGTGVPPRPPHRGLAMWSFPTRDLEAVAQRARQAGVTVVHPMVRYESPTLGRHRALTLLAPNGFLVEIFEAEERAARETSSAETGGTAADSLAAEQIVQRAISAAGGDTWRRPATLRLRGWAEWFPEGDLAKRVLLDTYAMDRVFPQESEEAHRANGKLRFEVRHGEELFLLATFDGQRGSQRLGPLAQPHEQRFASRNNYGYGILRFADGPGFELRRLADRVVDGHLCYQVRVQDPKGGTTVFGIDRRNYRIRSVSFVTELGLHSRVYSDFAWVDQQRRFLQPHRVRIENDGIQWLDVRWETAEVGIELAPELFQGESQQASTETP